MSGSRCVRASLLSQLLLLIYFEIIEWVNLFPWNNIRNGNDQELLDVILSVIVALSIALTWRKARWGMAIGAAVYALWAVLQIQTWWVQYIRGAAPWWKSVYERVFAPTIQIFPRVGNHLPPDACHTVLQLLLASALVSTVMATLTSGQKKYRSAAQQ